MNNHGESKEKLSFFGLKISERVNNILHTIINILVIICLVFFGFDWLNSDDDDNNDDAVAIAEKKEPKKSLNSAIEIKIEKAKFNLQKFNEKLTTKPKPDPKSEIDNKPKEPNYKSIKRNLIKKYSKIFEEKFQPEIGEKIDLHLKTGVVRHGIIERIEARVIFIVPFHIKDLEFYEPKDLEPVTNKMIFAEHWAARDINLDLKEIKQKYDNKLEKWKKPLRDWELNEKKKNENWKIQNKDTLNKLELENQNLLRLIKWKKRLEREKKLQKQRLEREKKERILSKAKSERSEDTEIISKRTPSNYANLPFGYYNKRGNHVTFKGIVGRIAKRQSGGYRVYLYFKPGHVRTKENSKVVFFFINKHPLLGIGQMVVISGFLTSESEPGIIISEYMFTVAQPTVLWKQQ